MNLVRVKLASAYCLFDFSSLCLQVQKFLYDLRSIMQNLNLVWTSLGTFVSLSANLFWVFSLVLNPKAGKSCVVLGFTANISHYSNSYLLLSAMPFESTASVWGFAKLWSYAWSLPFNIAGDVAEVSVAKQPRCAECSVISKQGDDPIPEEKWFSWCRVKIEIFLWRLKSLCWMSWGWGELKPRLLLLAFDCWCSPTAMGLASGGLSAPVGCAGPAAPRSARLCQKIPWALPENLLLSKG